MNLTTEQVAGDWLDTNIEWIEQLVTATYYSAATLRRERPYEEDEAGGLSDRVQKVLVDVLCEITPEETALISNGAEYIAVLHKRVVDWAAAELKDAAAR